MEELLEKLEQTLPSKVMEIVEGVINGESEQDLIELAESIGEHSDFIELSNGEMIHKKDIKRLSFSDEGGNLLVINKGASEKNNFADQYIELIGSYDQCIEEFKSIKMSLR